MSDEPGSALSSAAYVVALEAERDSLRAERDTLTAENEHLQATLSELRRVMQLDSLADIQLRSLRAAVARVADVTGEHIIGDEPWRTSFKALLALVPSDGSWLAE